MKRVGILTFHGAYNFGAAVQAWASPRILTSLGCVPEILDYYPVGRELKNRRTGIRRFIPSIGRYRFDQFVRTQLPMSPIAFRTRDEVDAYVRQQRFDAVLTGSDQVWFKEKYLGFDSTYFLDVGDPAVTARISFAPSAGPRNGVDDDSDRARAILSTYRAVSVRDTNTLALARSLGRNDAVEVLDPTIVADLQPLVQARPFGPKYLLIVGGMSPQVFVLLREIARRENLKVVEIGRSCSFADLKRPLVNPQEWVNYIAHASLVATSLFHGCAVSISLRRPFIAFDTAGRGFKLDDLLRRVGLMDRLITSDRMEQGNLPSALSSYDYSAVASRIELLRQVSIEFLRSAIHG